MKLLYRVFILLLSFVSLYLSGNDLQYDSLKGRSFSSSRIKVLISKNNKSINIGSINGFKIYDFQNKKALKIIPKKVIKINPDINGISIEGKVYKINAVVLKPIKGFLFIKKYSHRGDFILIKEGKTLLLVNSLSVEDYLKGVLPYEIDPKWPLTALKVQAIVSRSYAISKMRGNKNRYYDLDNTTFSQVYKGTVAEKDSTNTAVDQTCGLVIMYKGKVITAFFHACCGGSTEDSGNLWSISLPYLKSRRSRFCKGTKYYNWGVVLTRKEIRRQLGINTELKSARIISRFSSQRVKNLVITDKKGRRFIFSGKNFRKRIGYRKVKSLLFRIKLRGPYLQIRGNGWGHGVGLCQWCSPIMAKRGWSAEKIIKYFFKDVSIIRSRVQYKWE